MNTVQAFIYTARGIAVSIISPIGFLDHDLVVEDYGTYCGAGRGFGDIIVPDTIWGLNISPACAVHDEMWRIADSTWEAFHASNSIFLRNIISLIQTQSKNSFLKRLRMYRAVTYYNAVDSIGKNIFCELKHQQSLDK